jgi:thioredoxin reductase
MKTNSYEVIIIGGSYSGLSAAMSLGRALRKVLIIDSGRPCNSQTTHSHNFVTHDGSAPADIATAARKQVKQYETISFFDGLATGLKKTEDRFEITTESGKVFTAKKILFATGLKDNMPLIPGFAECWGISVLHCPYCHGYEVRNLKTALTANGDAAFEFAKLIAHWTRDFTLLTNGKSKLTDIQTNQLREHNIQIIETEIESIEHKNGVLTNIVLQDRTKIPAKALYARPVLEQHCKIPVDMGCQLTEQGLLKVDALQKTNIPGVFASGDNSSLARAVSVSVAAGTMAGASINKELVEEAF